MTDYRSIIAKNLIRLRVAAQYTQAEVASKLSYSDKAVSKWERAESIPDVAVLKAIADMYGVTVDYLLSEHGTAEELIPKETGPRRMTRNQTLITVISVLGVWFLAVVAFTVCFSFGNIVWPVFLWALPVSSVVALVLICVWGGRMTCFAFISLLLWSLSAAIYFTCIDAKPWLVFVAAAILQATVILSFGIRLSPKSNAGKKADDENAGGTEREVQDA